MSIYGSVRDRELSKFVESPSRGEPQVAVEVLVGNGETQPIPTFSVDQPGEEVLVFEEINAVAGLSTQNLIVYTVPLTKKLRNISIKLSGENKAVYSVLFNNVVVGKCRTWFGNFNNEIRFNIATLNQSSEVKVEVFNASNSTANFNVTMEGILNES